MLGIYPICLTLSSGELFQQPAGNRQGLQSLFDSFIQQLTKLKYELIRIIKWHYARSWTYKDNLA